MNSADEQSTLLTTSSFLQLSPLSFCDMKTSTVPCLGPLPLLALPQVIFFLPFSKRRNFNFPMCTQVIRAHLWGEAATGHLLTNPSRASPKSTGHNWKSLAPLSRPLGPVAPQVSEPTLHCRPISLPITNWLPVTEIRLSPTLLPAPPDNPLSDLIQVLLSLQLLLKASPNCPNL